MSRELAGGEPGDHGGERQPEQEPAFADKGGDQAAAAEDQGG